MTAVIEVIGSIIGLVVTVATVVLVVKALTKQGTVQAALDTVELLKAQVESLEARVKELTEENGKLTATVGVLREQVTQAAPVKELARSQEVRHEENLAALTRLEGSLGRLESHIMKVG